MSDITFSNEEKAILVEKLKSYFDRYLEQDIVQFECQFLLDFISSEIGDLYYNKGLNDAQAVILGKIDDITDTLYEIEKPTSFVIRRDD